MRRLLARIERRLRDRFIRIVLGVRSRITARELRAILEGDGLSFGDLRRQRTLVAIAEAAATALAAEVMDAYRISGDDAAAFLSRATGVTLDFDTTNATAVEALRRSRYRLIREFTEEQVEAVRVALTEATALGLNPRDQARAFRGAIGLTARQTAAVNNFARLLRERSPEALTRALRDRRFDATVLRAIREGTPLTEAQVATMTARYRQRYLKYRSEVIARTEALRAVHESSELALGQAIERGALGREDLERTWYTAADERVRGSHRAMHGQIRALGEPFVSGNGNLLRYPGDIDAPGSETIQCRCTVGTRVTVAFATAPLA